MVLLEHLPRQAGCELVLSPLSLSHVSSRLITSGYVIICTVLFWSQFDVNVLCVPSPNDLNPWSVEPLSWAPVSAQYTLPSRGGLNWEGQALSSSS